MNHVERRGKMKITERWERAETRQWKGTDVTRNNKKIKLKEEMTK
jgi:hypothetical protein